MLTHMATGEIVGGIVRGDIESAGVYAAKTAIGALQNAAAVLEIEEALRRRMAACRAKKLHWRRLCRNHSRNLLKERS